MKKFLKSYTNLIILINVVVFFCVLILMKIFEDSVFSLVALQPLAALAGKNLWTFLTSMFMHAPDNFFSTHLLVNMFSLFFLGTFVERLIGKKRFLWFYISAGLFAGLLYVGVAFLSGFSMETFAIGASGAIFGLGGLLAVLTPKLRVYIFFIIPMPMWIAMIAMLGILWVLSFTIGLPIGNVAHLGGLILGVGYGFYLKYKYPRRTKIIARSFGG